MQFQDIVCERTGRVLEIRFNRPEKLNAARLRTHEELWLALEAADADDAVRVVVVTGEGRAFCAGTDLSDGFDLPTGGDPATGEGVQPDVGGKASLRIFRMRKPVIAAVNGAAVGFGATVILPMDIRLASSSSRFGYVFSRRGIVAESCSSWFLPKVVGIATASEWMVTGRMIGAEEALAKGLVHEVLAPDELMPRARRIAEDIADNTAAVSVAVNRRLLWGMLGEKHPSTAHNLESRGLAATLALDDAVEGPRSFAEKRPPRFSGRASEADFLDAWWKPDAAVRG